MTYIITPEIAQAHRSVCIVDVPNQFDHRGMVLRSVCDLEVACARLLFAHFALNQPAASWEQAEAELFGENKMLGSLSRMANLGYYLGLLESEEVADLKTLARLRNMYAHGLERDQFYRDPKALAVLRSLNLVRSSQHLLDSHDEQCIFRACTSFIQGLLVSKAAAIAGVA